MQVRQERYRDQDLKLLIGNKKYDIENYSLYGIKVNSSEDLSSNEAKILQGNETINKFLIKLVRTDGLCTAYRLIDSCIDIDAIEALKFANMQINYIKSFNFDKIIDADSANIAYMNLVSLTENLANNIDQYINNPEFYQTTKDIQKKIILDKVGMSLSVVQENIISQIRVIPDIDLDTIKQLFRPYFFKSKLNRRMYEKPYGYAGDYKIIIQVYRQENEGDDTFSQLVQSSGMNFQGSRAVRNRAIYLKDKIINIVNKKNLDETTKIISIACGGAYEIQLLLQEATTEQLKNVEIHLLDQDLLALQHAQKEILKICSSRNVSPVIKFIQKDIKTIFRKTLDEKYDFIYSAGLFDYFNDKACIMAGKSLFNSLKEKGQLVIGNFSPENTTKDYMDIIAEWFLIYRSKADLLKLFGSLSNNIVIESEPENVNLFACLTKS